MPSWRQLGEYRFAENRSAAHRVIQAWTSYWCALRNQLEFNPGLAGKNPTHHQAQPNEADRLN